MTNRMWGGRFHESPGAVMEEISASIDFDRKLFRQDVAASKAHARMLGQTGIVAADIAERICDGLDTILREIEAGTFTFSRSLEDIHTHVEARLSQLSGIGPRRNSPSTQPRRLLGLTGDSPQVGEAAEAST